MAGSPSATQNCARYAETLAMHLHVRNDLSSAEASFKVTVARRPSVTDNTGRRVLRFMWQLWERGESRGAPEVEVLSPTMMVVVGKRCQSYDVFKLIWERRVVVHYRRWGKRAFDVTVASFLLVALSPIMVAVMLLTWAAHGTPVLFRQVRPGLYGSPFTILKFRTMRDMRDSSGALMPDNLRTTLVGHFLRKSSLDELPELINVIRGDMSLVGPRPLLTCYLPRYTEQQARRHDVRPGITGLAQVNGRNAISWDEKFAYDLEYVDGHTLALDIKILMRTVVAVLHASDVNASDLVTMPEFYGTVSQDASKN